MLLRETFAAGAFGCNCTVLACGDTKEAVVIDPGGETERIASIVAHYDLTVKAIIHTHAHLDHIYCTRDVKEAHGGEVCLHKDDLFLYDGMAMQASMPSGSPGWMPLLLKNTGRPWARKVSRSNTPSAVTSPACISKPVSEVPMHHHRRMPGYRSANRS